MDIACWLDSLLFMPVCRGLLCLVVASLDCHVVHSKNGVLGFRFSPRGGKGLVGRLMSGISLGVFVSTFWHTRGI
ncbi:hypothetical protein CC78DRAFT_169765 [Lojkania enalia]|uniref:Secreted protein n=1 Tax=Lojkania enalia TaxID=147567 RepID=A0A9P4KCB9_9PLEO|nr:hypothetical protein CC78DRAFT_169765 [Didymosphaeria enalia]